MSTTKPHITKQLVKILEISKNSDEMDEDIYKTQMEDENNIKKVEGALRDVRKQVWNKSKSF